MPKILKTKYDFYWYKKELDLKRRYQHDHCGGEPEKYPCIVVSHWGDNPNGPYYYDHVFYYKQKKSTICKYCGKKTTKVFWPKLNQ